MKRLMIIMALLCLACDRLSGPPIERPGPPEQAFEYMLSIGVMDYFTFRDEKGQLVRCVVVSGVYERHVSCQFP